MDAKLLFLKRLTLAMERRGLTQNGLADRLSVDGERVYASAVNNWLTKGTMPSGDLLMRLPTALDVDGHWLLTGEGEMERRPPDQNAKLLQQMRELLGVRPGGGRKID